MSRSGDLLPLCLARAQGVVVGVCVTMNLGRELVGGEAVLFVS